MTWTDVYDIAEARKQKSHTKRLGFYVVHKLNRRRASFKRYEYREAAEAAAKALFKVYLDNVEKILLG